MVYYFTLLHKNTFRIITKVLIESHKVGSLKTISRMNTVYDPPMHKNPTLFDAATEITIAVAKETLEKYADNVGVKLENLKIKGRLLDVGCGQGAVTKYITQYMEPNSTMEAFDVSPNLIEYAKKNYSADNIHYFSMDAAGEVPEQLKGRYDFVFCFNVLHITRDHRNILTNIKSMMKPNGKCLIEFFEKHQLFTAWLEVSKIPKYAPYMHDVVSKINLYHLVESSDEVFKNVMTDIGFKNVKTEIVKGKKYGKTNCHLMTYKSLFKGVDPFILRIPSEEEREEYLEEIMQAFIRNGGFYDYDPLLPNGGEPLYFKGIQLVTIGTK